MLPHAAPGVGPRPTASSVLIVDDQLAVREGVSRLLDSARLGLRHIDSAATGTEALSAVARRAPDVVILDIDLAGEDGLALIERLPRRTGVLVLSCYGDPATRERASRLGAWAFVEKHVPAAELIDALSTVMALWARGEESPGRAGESAYLGSVASSAVRGMPSP